MLVSGAEADSRQSERSLIRSRSRTASRL